MLDLRRAKANTALAALNGTGQFLHAARLQANVLPSLVQGLLDLFGYVDDLRRGDDIVPAMDKAIEYLVKPETVFHFAIFIKIADLTSMQDLTFASERCDGAQVRVHGGIHQARIIVVALNISRTVKPVDSQRLDALLWIVVDVDKFHDPAKVVRLAWRLAHKVHLV